MSKNMLKLHKLDLDDEADFDELDDELDDEIDDESYFEDCDNPIELDDTVEADELISEKEDDEELVTKGPYMVRVVVKMLKYFAGPSGDYPVLGVIKQNEKLKIIAETGSEESRWGKIDSKKQAWIPLIYCETID